MDFNKLKQIIYTLRFIKLTQIVFQIKYRYLKKNFQKTITEIESPIYLPNLKPFIEDKISYYDKEFVFLNKKKKFDKIDWNFSEYGKLWTYNLNYFDFLNQSNLDCNTGLNLMIDYCDSRKILKDGLEPYPISLRIINWVKFISKNKIDNTKVNIQLYNDYLILQKSLEFHILANHLLENVFSLFFGAHYFNNRKELLKAEKLLNKELKEQVLEDGAHYELTPMYHKIILLRTLDAYNLAISNNLCSKQTIKLLYSISSKMLSWLEAISFDNGEIPMVNDSSHEITPSNSKILIYADSLGIKFHKTELKESGYRKLNHLNFEVLFDIGQIAPSYQPGHSHADNLNILLNYKNIPIIVDTGISTYEKNKIRQLERSSSSHNVVTLNNKNSSDVWSGFRVGKRAKTKIIKDTKTEIIACHNGYKSDDVLIYRTLKIEEDIIRIFDVTNSNDKILTGHLHFHPNNSLEISNNQITVNKKIIITFTDIISMKLNTYNWCKEFNLTELATKVEYTFSKKCIIDISEKNEDIISY
jgi:hypothetical protein